MIFRPARCHVALRFPVQLPGGTIASVEIDLDRPGRACASTAQVARIIGLPESLISELAEFDYVRILLKIEELNNPRLAAMSKM